MKESKKKIRQFTRHSQDQYKRSKAKNDLESYIYSFSEWLELELFRLCTSEE